MALMREKAGTIEEGVFKRHRPAGLAEGRTIRTELAMGVAAPFGEGDGGKTTGSMEVFVDVESIEGGVESAELGFAAQTSLDFGHEREEVRDIGLVEGLGKFSQDKFTPIGDFGRHDPGSIAPIVLTDRDSGGRLSVT